MCSMQIANSLLEWERRIQYQNETWRNHRPAPYFTDLPANPEPCPARKETILDRLFRRSENRGPVKSTRKDDNCKDPQPC